MSMQLLLNQHMPTPQSPNKPPPPQTPPPLRQTTELFVSKRQCQVVHKRLLAALAKRQFGGLERHLCCTLELGLH